MALLIQFLLRLTFGLALGMAITSSRLVTSGYFRNHLYVTLGLASLAALLSYSFTSEALEYALAAAVCSYVASVCWLYEKPGPGKVMLFVVVLVSFIGASLQSPSLNDFKVEKALSSIDSSTPATEAESLPKRVMWLGFRLGALSALSIFSSGLLLGMTMAAMLLGHWYLNAPGMELLPLRRLIMAVGVAVVLQTVLSALGLWGEIAATEQLSLQWILFVVLRWTFGLLGVGVMAWMAWQTLKIPNTQSATGILYVAVIGAFVGETMALLLSSESLYPL
ncbi:MAG: hypothetical protein MI725_07130 [Pirellulales bacterium]|nr:hypothetical protein [Pirellulales bacterium]